MQDQQMRALKM